MQTIHCDLHNLDIKIYTFEEQNSFIDNNKKEVVIFIDEKGNKQLKRYIINECDENCEIIKGILEN